MSAFKFMTLKEKITLMSKIEFSLSVWVMFFIGARLVRMVAFGAIGLRVRWGIFS